MRRSSGLKVGDELRLTMDGKPLDLRIVGRYVEMNNRSEERRGGEEWRSRDGSTDGGSSDLDAQVERLEGGRQVPPDHGREAARPAHRGPLRRDEQQIGRASWRGRVEISGREYRRGLFRSRCAGRAA